MRTSMIGRVLQKAGRAMSGGRRRRGGTMTRTRRGGGLSSLFRRVLR